MSLVSPQGPVYQAGTLSGNPLAMSVGLAQLSYLNNHPDVYEYINKAANYLENGIKTILSTLSLDYQVHRCQSLLTLFLPINQLLLLKMFRLVILKCMLCF